MFDMLVKGLELKSLAANPNQVVSLHIEVTKNFTFKHPKHFTCFKDFKLTRGALQHLLYGKQTKFDSEIIDSYSTIVHKHMLN